MRTCRCEHSPVGELSVSVGASMHIVETVITRLLEVMIMTLAGFWQAARQDFNPLEIAIVAAGVWAWKRGWRPNFPLFWSPSRPGLVALAMAVGVVVLRVALVLVIPVPTPVIPDESSHLLLADTLLHGRVANPTHPFWQHFESLHIIQQPHYVSNYFPGHALLLALGRLVIGNAWAGVLAECAVFLTVLYWMLRGWMPARWAVFGVLLASLRFGIGSYWVNAFHGGFLAATGGALIAGAFPRIRRRPSVAQGAVFGIGLGILASTRPFEGFIYCVPFALMLVWELRKRAAPLLTFALPAAAVTLMALLGLGSFLSRITGSPFASAYTISQKVYGWPMSMAWMKPPPVQHRHIEFQRYYEYEVGEHEKVSGPIYFIEFLTIRLQEYWRFFVGPTLSVPLVMLGFAWRRRKTRMLFVGLFAGLFSILLAGASLPHYLAPATAVIIAILLECCRYLQAARVRILPLLPAVMMLVLLLRTGAQAVGLPFSQSVNFQSWCCRQPGDLNQARVTAELQRDPGNHLVFVRAKGENASEHQWIYNDADIDASRIVWARDLGTERNSQLMKYFIGRHVWIVDPNLSNVVLQQYSLPARVH